MRKLNQAVVLIVTAALLLSAMWRQASAQDAPQPSPARKSFAEIVNMPVVYTIPGMNEVQIKKDIAYKPAANPDLKLDVYLPKPEKAAKRGAVFFIHGGTALENRPKDWGIFASWGKLAAASGMVGVVFTHRMGFPKPDFALAESDLAEAINYVRNNAEAFNVDKDRIALVAFSGGGPLLSVPMRDAQPFVRALVSVYGFLDIQQSEMHRRGIGDSEILKKYSPISHLAPNAARLPPIFVARAGRDEIPGINDAADRFVAEALAKNVPIEVMNHPTGVHGFDNQTDDAHSKEIIRRVLEFLKTNLKETNRTANDNAETVKRFFELFNRHEWDMMANLYAENPEFLDPSFGIAPVKKTRRETAEKYRQMAKIFPDLRDDVKNIYPSGENVIVEFVSTGTAPDGKRFTLPISSILTFENGLIVRDATYYDNPK